MLVANIGQTAPYTPLVAESTTSSSSSSSTLSTKSSTDNPMITTSSISKGSSENNSSNSNQQRIGPKSNGLENYSFGLLKNMVYDTPTSSTPRTNAVTSTIGSRSYLQAYTSAPANMLKSLTVHLNRGTETLKSTMQKALFSAVSARNRVETKSDHSKNDSIHGNTTLRKDTNTNTNNCKFVDPSLIKTSTISLAYNFVISAKTEKEFCKTDNSAKRKNLDEESLSSLTVNDLPITLQKSVNSIPPTEFHRSPNGSKHYKSDSVDSLHKEMCHFKPICSVPSTPWESENRFQTNLIQYPLVQKIYNSLENTEGKYITPKVIGSMATHNVKELHKPKSSALSQSLLRRKRSISNRRRYRSAFVWVQELNPVIKMNSMMDVNNSVSNSLRRNTRSRMTLGTKSNTCVDVQPTPTRSRLLKAASKSKSMLLQISDSNSSQQVHDEVTLPSMATLNNSRKSVANICINFKPQLKKSKFCVASNRDMRRLRNYVHFADEDLVHTHVGNPAKYNTRKSMVFDFVENCPDTDEGEISHKIPWSGKKLTSTRSCMLNIVQLAKDTNAALKKAAIIPEQNTSQHILAVTKPLTRKEACQSAIPVRRRGRKRNSSYLRQPSLPSDTKDGSVTENIPGYQKNLRRNKPTANNNVVVDKKPANDISNNTINAITKTKSIKSFASVKSTNTNNTKRKRMTNSISNYSCGQNMNGNRLKEVPTSKRFKESAINSIQSKIYSTNSPMTRLQYRKMFTREISPPIFSVDQIPYM